jgi:hypothetical protein
MNAKSLFATLGLALGVAQATPAATITNGSFETGTFAGWIATDIFVFFFPLSVQTAGSANTFDWPWSSSPTDGMFTAFSGFDGSGPGTISLEQDIGLVTAGDSLTFDYRAAWDLVNFGGGTIARLFDVVIEPEGGGGPLATINFITAAPGTFVSDTGQLTGSVNLSAFAGQSIRVSFELTVPEDFTGPAQWQLDNVGLVAVPEPASLALLGLGLLGLGVTRRRAN